MTSKIIYNIFKIKLFLTIAKSHNLAVLSNPPVQKIYVTGFDFFLIIG